ncbi:MAG TPA: hypothetical protein VIW24_17145 [Aldersonia sp.]
MTTWKTDELDRIGAATELRISSRRTDGSLRRPVTHPTPPRPHC